MAPLGRNGAGSPPRSKRSPVSRRRARGVARRRVRRAGGPSRTTSRAPAWGNAPEDRQALPEHSVEDNLFIAAKKGPQGAGRLELGASVRDVPAAGPAPKSAWPGLDRAASSRCSRSPAR